MEVPSNLLKNIYLYVDFKRHTPGRVSKSIKNKASGVEYHSCFSIPSFYHSCISQVAHCLVAIVRS